MSVPDEVLKTLINTVRINTEDSVMISSRGEGKGESIQMRFDFRYKSKELDDFVIVSFLFDPRTRTVADITEEASLAGESLRTQLLDKMNKKLEGKSLKKLNSENTISALESKYKARLEE